jgi:hypothetical protein
MPYDTLENNIIGFFGPRGQGKNSLLQMLAFFDVKSAYQILANLKPH